ncbi:MAG: SDR family oxidoreductase [Sneathiella sp.]|nr:SDR family oxidoreductase [Sneathiella sp.]
MSDLTGKQALVTSGGSGVGEVIALALATEGAHVTITGRTQASLERVADKHENIHLAIADVTDPDAMKQIVAEASRKRRPISIAIANAGIADSKPFGKMNLQDWNSAISTNLTGVFNTYQAILPHIERCGWGRLIAIASTAGLKGYGYVSAYAAAKHGVIGLTKSLALELAHQNITVNAVCPGFTETPMLERSFENIMAKTGMSHGEARDALARTNPQNRFIQPEEIAQSVLWLCGPNSGSITGQAISISGGEI